VVLVGYGRVGGFIGSALPAGTPLLVIESEDGRAAKAAGHELISGNAADPDIIRAANLPAARCLLVAIPDAFEGGQVVAQARERNAALPIIARAHSQAEIEHLKKHGATVVVMAEHEAAKAIIAAMPPPASTPAPTNPADERPA
jgi:CPA2 family monovalent cation:H+ antiporter-2